MKHLPKKLIQFALLILSCCQLAQGAPESRASLSSKILHANALLKVGKNSEAIAILKPLAADLPRHGLLALAKAYHAQKNYLEETRILETTFGQNDKDYYVQNLLGECYLANKDLEKAADNFSGAKELKNNYIPAYLGLVKTYEAKGQLDDARQVFTDMIHIFGLKKSFMNEICRLYSLEGSVQEGIVACQRATSFDPTFPANHIYLGRMLVENDQTERGEMIILKAAKRFKKSEPAQLAAGNIKLKHRQWHDAANIFSQATIANPKSDEGFLGWGKSLFEMQKYGDAKVALFKACTFNKKHLGDLRNAIAELRQKNKLIWATQYETGLGSCGG